MAVQRVLNTQGLSPAEILCILYNSVSANCFTLFGSGRVTGRIETEKFNYVATADDAEGFLVEHQNRCCCLLRLFGRGMNVDWVALGSGYAKQISVDLSTVTPDNGTLDVTDFMRLNFKNSLQGGRSVSPFAELQGRVDSYVAQKRSRHDQQEEDAAESDGSARRRLVSHQ